MRSQIKSLFRLVVIAILNVSVLAGGVYLPSRYFTRSQLMKHQETYSPSRSRRLSKFCSAKDETATFLVSRSRKTRGDDTNEEQDEEMAPAERKFEDLSYSDLGPVGKTVAGVTEIVFATAFDFCSGYLQGFLFGTLFGSPGFIFRPVTKGVRQPFRTELSGRFARMNARSTSWAKTLGTFSAAFGGVSIFTSRFLTNVPRGCSIVASKLFSHRCLLFSAVWCCCESIEKRRTRCME